MRILRVLGRLSLTEFDGILPRIELHFVANDGVQGELPEIGQVQESVTHL